MEGDTGLERVDERGRFAPARPGPREQAPAAPPLADAYPPPPRRRGRRWSSVPGRLAAAAKDALTLEQERGTVFLFVPVFLAAGAATYFLLPAEPATWALASDAAALAAAMRLARSRPVLRLAFAAALIFVLGLAAGKLETWRAGTQMMAEPISTRLTGRVVAVEHRADGSARLTLDVLKTERPHLRYAPERLRATARDLPEAPRAGDTIAGIVRLLPPTGPLRPQSYDFSFQNYFDGLGANGFFLAGPWPAAVKHPAGVLARVSAWVENARAGLAARVRATVPGAEGEIAAALLTGSRSGIPDEASEALRKAGLAHILAISGLHMALVALVVIGAIRAGFAFFPDFSSRHPVKKYAAAAALAAVGLYLLVSGAAVAAQRAFIMIAIMLAALLFDRAALTMRNLALSAIVVVAVSPHEVVGPSFQMSFAATAALIAAYAWFAERRQARPRNPDYSEPGMVRKLLGSGLYFFGGLALTSLIAGLATGLFAAWHFQRAAPLGLVANLAAMPVVTVVVMPAAVASVVALPFGLDGLFLPIMGWGIGLVLDVARFLAERAPFDDVGLIPAGAVVMFALALVLATLPTTWLRVGAIPFALAGTVLVASRQFPDALVSEDGRQVAVVLADGTLAVNRSRPNAFTIEDWQRALMADRVVKPHKAEEGSGPAPPKAGASAFACGPGLCTVAAAGGGMVAYAENAEAASSACATAAIIVIDDATAESPCPAGTALVVTKRQLALQGSAAIYLDHTGARGPPRLVQAISLPLRPWHDQRRYSRAARGLAPWRRSDGDE